MMPIEQHWSLVRSLLADEQLSDEHMALCRELFFGGALTLLAILSELNHMAQCDREFDSLMDALFKEAKQGCMVSRYRPGVTRGH